MNFNQLIIIGLDGKKLSKEERKIIEKFNPGGIILFSKNGESPKDFHSLIKEIKKIALIPPFIVVDQENGVVNRIKKGVTTFPDNFLLGKLGKAFIVYKVFRIISEEIYKIGIDINLAPVADLFNEFLKERSFGKDPKLVSKMVKSAISASIKEKIIPCVKHFPGHGTSTLDSHNTLPTVSLSYDKLRKTHLLPFIEAIKVNVPLIMTSHILFKNIDKDFPVTLSSKFLKEILRKDLNFSGLIISDDLEMKAISENFSLKDRIYLALRAGVDLLIFSNTLEKVNRFSIFSILEELIKSGKLNEKEIEEKIRKIINLKKKFPVFIERGNINKDLTTLEKKKFSEKLFSLCYEKSYSWS